MEYKKNTMKEFTSKLITYMMMVCVALCTTGCGSDSDEDGTTDGTYEDMALENLNGHELKFYYEYEGKLYRAMALYVDKQGTPNVLSYSAVQMIGVTKYAYVKTNQSKATVSMTVMYYQASPDPEGWSDPWHQYDMELNFVSGNQGYAKVTTQYKTLVNGLLTTVKKDDLWYFKIDSDELPDKTLIDICIGNSEGNDDGDGEGNSENVVTSKALKTKVNFVQDGERPCIAVGFTKNSTTGLPDKTGFCIGTSPQPTIENAIIKLNENDECLNGFSRIIGNSGTTLKRGTTYYIRPYHKTGNKIIYYEETSVETLGKNYILTITPTLTKYYNLDYNLKKEGTYTLGITCKVKTANGDKYYREELKTVGKGSGSMSWDSSKSGYDLEDIYYIEFNARDKATGILYISDMASGRAGAKAQLKTKN